MRAVADAGPVTDFHLARVHPARALGWVAPIAGLGVLGLLAASTLLDGSLRTAGLGLGWLLVVVGFASTGIVAWRLVRPPVLVRLDASGLRLRVLRGAGPTTVAWGDVRTVRREQLAVGSCVVVELGDGRRTVVPAQLVDEGGAALVAALATRLDHAHRQRRLQTSGDGPAAREGAGGPAGRGRGGGGGI